MRNPILEITDSYTDTVIVNAMVSDIIDGKESELLFTGFIHGLLSMYKSLAKNDFSDEELVSINETLKRLNAAETHQDMIDVLEREREGN